MNNKSTTFQTEIVTGKSTKSNVFSHREPIFKFKIKKIIVEVMFVFKIIALTFSWSNSLTMFTIRN